MKHFFYIFFTFFCIFSYILNANAQDLSEQSNEIQITSDMSISDSFVQKIVDLQQNANQKMQKALAQNPEDISFVDKPESRNIYTLLTLSSKNAGVLTGTKGLGAYQTFDFGSARFISCQGSLNNNPILITALQVDINDGWILQKPVILPSQSALWFSEKIFYPLRLHQRRTDSYQEQVMFPIVYHLTDVNKSFYTEKEITLTACQKDNCQTQTKSFSLAVDSGKGYSTDVCAAIMQELAQSTFALPENVKVSLHKNKQNVYQLVVDYPEKVDGFELQIANNWPYTLIKQSIQNNRVIVLFQPEQNIDTGELVDLKLLSSLGWFETKMSADDKPFVRDLVFFSYKTGLKNIFLFLFFSPFYLAFWSLRVQNQLELTQKIKKIKQCGFVFFAVISCILYFQLPVSSFLQSVPVLSIQFLLLLWLIYKPTISVNMIFVYLFIMPYPFIYDTFLTFPKNQILAVFWSALWTGGCLIPFIALRKVPQFFKVLDTAQKPILKIMRLPLMMMLCWILGLLIVSFYTPVKSYTEKDFQEAIQADKSIFISVENKACLNCFFNQISASFVEPVASFVRDDKLVLLSVKQDSPEGRAFLQKYDIPQGVSFNLLITPIRMEGIRIENNYLQSEDWYKYLIETGMMK